MITLSELASNKHAKGESKHDPETDEHLSEYQEFVRKVRMRRLDETEADSPNSRMKEKAS